MTLLAKITFNLFQPPFGAAALEPDRLERWVFSGHTSFLYCNPLSPVGQQ